MAVKSKNATELVKSNVTYRYMSITILKDQARIMFPNLKEEEYVKLDAYLKTAMDTKATESIGLTNGISIKAVTLKTAVVSIPEKGLAKV